MAQRLAKHGSNAGYKAEQKTGQICDRCRNAHRVYNTQYTKTGKAKGLHYGHYDVIDHLAKPVGTKVQAGTRQVRPETVSLGTAQTEAIRPETAEQTEPGTGQPGIGQRLRDAVSRLAVPDQSERYVEDSEIPDYLRTIDPDPEPADPDNAEVITDDFVITRESMALIEENMGTYLSVIGMTLEMVDPYCGPILADNFDNIVGRWSKVVARYPAAAKMFMSKGGGTIMDWIGAIQATWPVLYAIYEHHLSRSVVTEKGKVYRVNQSANGQTQTVDPTMPPMQDQFAYTVN